MDACTFEVFVDVFAISRLFEVFISKLSKNDVFKDFFFTKMFLFKTDIIATNGMVGAIRTTLATFIFFPFSLGTVVSILHS